VSLLLAASAKSSATSSSVVLSNVGYLIGLVVLVVVVVSIVVLRHRKPVSTEAHMDSFHRGLAALSPEQPSGRRRSGQAQHQPQTMRPDPLTSQSRIRGIPAKADGAMPRRPSTGSKSG
jgi:hypothetical protein